ILLAWTAGLEAGRTDSLAVADAGLHEVGTEDRETDLLVAELRGPAFAHRDDRIFGGGIGFRERTRDESADRRGVENVSGLAVRPDQGQERLDPVDHALDVDV